ncbi:MAG TPA: TlpA disulfide reductase family protein [Thermoanaerobaculia bacterium]
MRTILVIALAVLIVLAGTAYWYSHRQMVVERPNVGGPPPAAGPPAAPYRPENLVGRAAPGFRASDQNGRVTGTDAFRGRVAVVNVWASWCPPCVEELPRFESEVWGRFGTRVAVIAVAAGESAEKVQEFNRKANLTFSLVEDPKQRIARRFGGRGPIPRTYVINRSGTIVYQTIGYSEDNFREIVAAVEQAVAGP